MIIIAHRRNTMRAFYRAVEMNCDAVETDIRKCACGKLVLSHDKFGDHTCEEFPNLWDILRFGKQMDLHIEIKEKDLLGSILRITSQSKYQMRFIYSSFRWFELWKLRRLHKNARIGLLWGESAKMLPKFLVRLAAYLVGAESVHISIKLIKKDSSLVSYFRGKGFAVYSYTVNEIEDIILARTTGMDGIFTDFPDRAMKILSMSIH